jgi:hypothetical protein
MGNMRRLSFAAFVMWHATYLAACTGTTANVGDGGAPSSDGGGACIGATMTFTMTAANASAFCVGAGCSTEFVTIIDPSGHELMIDQPCITDCNACAPTQCPALCPAPTPMKPQGEQRVWDGTYLAQSTCGAGTACVAKSCAAPGHYTAKMCAYANSGQGPAGFCSVVSTPTCVDVAFDWPPAGGSGSVEGMIGGPADAGLD